MTVVAPVATESAELTLARLTPEQRRTLARMDRAPWRWFVSDARYYATLDRFKKDSQRRYFATISRVTQYRGPDYRVRFPEQASWVRVNWWQYEQAGENGIPRSIWTADDGQATV